MITSAASTIDSTFLHSSKLMVVDLGKKGLHTISKGAISYDLGCSRGHHPRIFRR
ncbi:MAG: hypothetical protein WKF59_10405 [Chitinophagaceae bacterium]